MTNDTISINDFSLNWRFTDDNYNKLPIDDLNQIKPLSIMMSQEKWKQYVDDEHDHLMKMQQGNDKNALQIKDCGWGDEQQENKTKETLEEKLDINYDDQIIFFWGSKTSVITKWGLFLKYWTDFCYPSDDSNIIIIGNYSKAIIYVEDNIRIVDRKIEFGRN